MTNQDWAPCVVCEQPANPEHHQVFRSQGGTDADRIPVCRTHHQLVHDERISVHLEDGTATIVNLATGEVIEKPYPGKEVAILGEGVGEAYLTVLPEWLRGASTEALVGEFRRADRFASSVLGILQRGIVWELRRRLAPLDGRWAEEVGRLVGREAQTVREWAHTYDVLFRGQRKPVELEGVQVSVLDYCAHKADPELALTIAQDHAGAPARVIKRAVQAAVTDVQNENPGTCLTHTCQKCGATWTER